MCGLQGELEITTEAGSGKAAQPGPDGQLHDHVERVPFLMLALDLPPAPLYKDALDKDIIPQVPFRSSSPNVRAIPVVPSSACFLSEPAPWSPAYLLP